ncbi:CCA tRNA nucleotidyltransferase [Pseudonocardia abyssalis]|uniref:CCA tRNA nucleotidyltransferase n=1 Tax=Pseudonocardia abyssalis TaxID=2792008 RepID=A0ABS6UZA0_9PSEU|nr:CCA tRNA nucleotidyltransferase [Pseudonocardia abyssalis]MBW0118376.1 CCA tRNA nucleotidyltransferase [Pseudonocardia abyssalis]MBW0137306.1 CCA tRNA nucleotidyltransferase [Pseudonocardia abyssalis]
MPPTDLLRAQHNALVDLVPIPPVADELAQRFAAAGHRLYLVGGSVRDALLGRGVNDLDFTTDARPQDVLAALAGWADAVWDTGIAFGTVGARRKGQTVEITTFRADSYDGVTRNPVVAFGESIDDDLVRRDFSVNAMAVELTGERMFVDPHSGLAALHAGTLDTPATPEQSFSDDPLRMLRAARFVSQLGLAPAPRVVAAMTAMAGELSRITAERVQAELSKLLLGAHPRRAIELLVDTGLAEIVLPEVPAMRLAVDEHMQHKDVYVHSLVVLEQAIDRETDGPDLVLRLAALLHDIGKPATRRKEADGRVSFHHHEVVGAKMTRRRLRELRYPKAVIDEVAQLVFLHLRFHGYGNGAWTDSAVRRYVTDAGPLLERLHRLVRSDCTTRNRRRAAALQRSYDGLEERIAALREQEQLDAIRPDLDGNAIMEILGIPAGPQVGKAYKHLLAVRMEQGPLTRDEAEAELRRWAAGNG